MALVMTEMTLMVMMRMMVVVAFQQLEAQTLRMKSMAVGETS